MFLPIEASESTAPDDDLESLTMGVAGGRIAKDEVIEFFAARVRNIG